MKKAANWNREERLIAFRLYCQEPFGRLHTGNLAVNEIAKLIGRTPSAVVFKACNFASLDPFHQARGVSGFKNISHADRDLWKEFEENSEAVAAEAEEVFERVVEQPDVTIPEPEWQIPEGPTEVERIVRTRRVQRFFRTSVLANYNYTCAISGIAFPELLIAGHIIPWSVNEQRRADPRNGVALHALYERAFDRGLIGFDQNLRVMVSSQLKINEPSPLHRSTLVEIEGLPLNLPQRFRPDETTFAFHREHIFKP